MKVLIVDDEPGVRNLLAAAIGLVGYEQLDMAEDGEQALALAMAHRYDLVPLDIRMPIIAIISAYTADAIDVDISDADLVVKKPFRLEVIQELAQHVTELAEKQNAIRDLSDEVQKA